MTEEYNFENIRALLIGGFDNKELRDFCHDNPKFKPVHDRLAQGTGKQGILFFQPLLDHPGR